MSLALSIYIRQEDQDVRRRIRFTVLNLITPYHPVQSVPDEHSRVPITTSDISAQFPSLYELPPRQVSQWLGFGPRFGNTTSQAKIEPKAKLLLDCWGCPMRAIIWWWSDMSM